MRSSTFIVVGTGVFGSSTALELVRAGHEVILLDRSLDGYCAPDAASNDLNKIVRADYSDAHYRELAKSAISIWRRSELFKPFYHEVGVLFHTGASSDVKAGKEYVDLAIKGAHASSSFGRELPYVGQSLKPAAHVVRTEDEIRQCFPKALQSRLGRMASDVAKGTGSLAYFNPRGGWAEANRATRATLDEAKRLGAKVFGEAHVESLLFDKNDATQVRGVRCVDGREFYTSGEGQVAICAGAWAESLLGSLLRTAKLPAPPPLIPTWSSAQCVLTVQLSEEQRKAFAGAPVILEFASGFYLFEPDENGLLKIAIHSSGYRYPAPPTEKTAPLAFPTFDTKDKRRNTKSEPERKTPAHMLKKSFIPDDQTQQMLAHLGYIYPELANAPVVYERICFYSESLDENWIIDHVPNVKGVVVASGDSGHAFKFLPVLGNLVCARMGIQQAGTLTDHQKRVFSFAYHADVTKQSAQSVREATSFRARL